MAAEGDGGVVCVADLIAGRVPGVVVGALDGEPCRNRAGGDEFDDGAMSVSGRPPRSWR